MMDITQEEEVEFLDFFKLKKYKDTLAIVKPVCRLITLFYLFACCPCKVTPQILLVAYIAKTKWHTPTVDVYVSGYILLSYLFSHKLTPCGGGFYLAFTPESLSSLCSTTTSNISSQQAPYQVGKLSDGHWLSRPVNIIG